MSKFSRNVANCVETTRNVFKRISCPQYLESQTTASSTKGTRNGVPEVVLLDIPADAQDVDIPGILAGCGKL